MFKTLKAPKLGAFNLFVKNLLHLKNKKAILNKKNCL